MAYSKFTLAEVYKNFHLEENRIVLFPDLEPVELSEWLKKSLMIANKSILLTEKAKSERIVSPILFEWKERNGDTFEIYSGISLNVDAENDLNGECDFLVSFKSSYVIQAPIFALVEAKNDNIEQGLGQCVAQMLGALTYNRNENRSISVIYGCVTNGEEWQFLKLIDKQVFIDSKKYYLYQANQIVAVLEWIVEQSTQS